MKDVRFSELCQWTPKQREATKTADAHRFVLYGGSRGPGKSFWLRWYLLRQLLAYGQQQIKGVDVMLACEDYPSLTKRQTNKIEREFPLWLGTLQASKSKGLGFHLRPEFGGGSILLCNLDDPSKYQSAEFAIIGIDELTKNNLTTFDIMRGSLRWPGIARTQFVAASNPEPTWVRDYWIEKRFPPELEGMAGEFAFVPGLPTDNPHLDATYWQDLNTLSGARREAWLHGDWYAAVEGLVYDNFSEANIVDDLAPDLEAGYEIAVDDGYIDPRATLFIQRLPGGDVFVFDELYETKTLEEATIEHIGQRAAEHGLGLPAVAVASHEAVALRDRLTEAGIPAQNWLAEKVGGGKSTRLAAVTLTRQLICDGQKHRGLYVHRRCRNLLDELRAGYKYPEGKHGLEAEPEDGHDHACQALESWVWARKAGAWWLL